MRVKLRALLGASILVAVAAALLHGGPKSSDARLSSDHRARIELGGDRDRGKESGGRNPSQEAYENRAYPLGYIPAAQVKAGRAAVRGMPTRLRRSSFRAGVQDVGARAAVGADWQFIGPDDPFAPGPTTESLRDSITSGRITALGVNQGCDAGGTGTGACRVYVAAAGGGVWRSD